MRTRARLSGMLSNSKHPADFRDWRSRFATLGSDFSRSRELKVYMSLFFSTRGGLFFGDNCSDLPPRNWRRNSSFDLNVRPANCPW